MNFRHFLLTRFNVKWKGEKGVLGATDDWSEQITKLRLSLFENITCPSISSQTNKNFKWLVFFDENSPNELRQEIERLRKIHGFVPCFTPMLERLMDTQKNYIPYILNEMEELPEHLITSRVDADDALCKDYIQLVQSNFAGQDFQFLNFPYGAQKILGEAQGVKWTHLKNMYQTLIEKVDKVEEIKIIWKYNHGLTRKFGPVHQIETSGPAWLCVIHGDNRMNKKKRGVPLPGISDYFEIND